MLSRDHAVTRLFLCIFSFLLLCAAGCEKDSGRVDGGSPHDRQALARVGKKAITVREYREQLALLPADYRDAADLYKEQFLEGMINKHLLLQEAQRRELYKNPRVRDSLQKAREEIMIQALIDEAITSKVKIGADEIEEQYRKNKDVYRQPPQINASHILLDSKVVAIKVLDDLRRGGDFAALAKQYSLDGPTKDKGGNIGYFTKGTLLPAFERACEELDVGETSGVVKTALGYHIIKVLDKKEAGTKTLEAAKQDIIDELAADKQIKLYKDLLDRLRSKQNITIDKDLLETVAGNTLPSS